MAENRRTRSRSIDPDDKKRKVNKQGLREIVGIFRFIGPHKWYFILSMIVLLLGTVTTMAFPFLLGELVNAASPEAAEALMEKLNENVEVSAMKEMVRGYIPTDINSIVVLLLAVLGIQAVLSFLRIYFSEQVSQRTMADIRYATYRKLITFSIPFFEQKRVGELTSRLSSDVTQLQDVLSFALFEFLRQILVLILGLIILFVLVSAKLATFMLAIIPVIVVGALIFGRYIRKLSKKTQDELAETNTIVDETLHAILVVKAFASELRESIRYRLALDRVVRIGLKTAVFRGIFTGFVFGVLFGGITLVVWKGATMIQNNEILAGDLVTFMLYTVFIAGSVAGLGSLYTQLQKTIGASERLREILDTKAEFDLPEMEESGLPRLTGNIVFDKVAFSYPSRDDVQVLHDVSLSIQKGQKIALVGHSGAGKSTIAQLILRLYDIQGGKIEVDGKNISTYGLPYLRKNMGIVPQEVILFGGTIRENIGYGKPEATDEELIEAAKQANAWEFIDKFPEGLETVVGERGIKLSGGQRQRVAIARAILKDPAILILDEATSSLDSESEKLVQDALNQLMEGRTTVIIAHRLSTIREVDQIYVLDEGRIVEAGSHQELSAKSEGLYTSLLRLQFAES
ncbi:MAG: ABC transporter ATP-binding protein [Bacteroidota bacterium]